MNWRGGYIAVDWGTTNRRAYLTQRDGSVVNSFEDDRGLLAVPPGTFAAETAAIRGRLGDWPMLMAGMVGSARGWREVPYVGCPASLDDLSKGILWIEPARTGIVPGVAQHGTSGTDVMRGEEVQVFGALAAGLVPRNGLACLPGTHTKWIVLEDGAIVRFRTMMTGELFGLLKTHSILADQLQSDVTPGAAFEAGVAEGLKGISLLSALFGIRARHALGQPENNAAAHASGLLIGSDVHAGLELQDGGAIGLIGQPDLCRLYGAALDYAGYQARQVDGATAFLAGIHALTERL
ncbi:MAG TPA: 2-dehydro-3-deoxygalactonokinase [Croceibacterium sp.]|nr:2-dehydro-3-deoxygalactonokinase [Croceibacterium sp.]